MIPNPTQIYLIGFYEEREFALYVLSISNLLKLPIRYLKGDKPHTTANGLCNSRDIIMEDDLFSTHVNTLQSHNLPAEL